MIVPYHCHVDWTPGVGTQLVNSCFEIFNFAKSTEVIGDIRSGEAKAAKGRHVLARPIAKKQSLVTEKSATKDSSARIILVENVTHVYHQGYIVYRQVVLR